MHQDAFNFYVWIWRFWIFLCDLLAIRNCTLQVVTCAGVGSNINWTANPGVRFLANQDLSTKRPGLGSAPGYGSWVALGLWRCKNLMQKLFIHLFFYLSDPPLGFAIEVLAYLSIHVLSIYSLSIVYLSHSSDCQCIYLSILLFTAFSFSRPITTYLSGSVYIYIYLSAQLIRL